MCPSAGGCVGASVASVVGRSVACVRACVRGDGRTRVRGWTSIGPPVGPDPSIRSFVTRVDRSVDQERALPPSPRRTERTSDVHTYVPRVRRSLPSCARAVRAVRAWYVYVVKYVRTYHRSIDTSAFFLPSVERTNSVGPRIGPSRAARRRARNRTKHRRNEHTQDRLTGLEQTAGHRRNERTDPPSVRPTVGPRTIVSFYCLTCFLSEETRDLQDTEESEELAKRMWNSQYAGGGMLGDRSTGLQKTDTVKHPPKIFFHVFSLASTDESF